MLHLKHCMIQWTDYGALSIFPDGKECGAWPHDTFHYRLVAHRLGYGDDILRYTREHELCHSLVSEWFFDCASPVLVAVANGKPLSGKESAYEECMTQALQRWINTNEEPIISGVDWYGMKSWACGALETLK